MLLLSLPAVPSYISHYGVEKSRSDFWRAPSKYGADHLIPTRRIWGGRPSVVCGSSGAERSV